MSDKKDKIGGEGNEEERRLEGRSFQTLDDSGTLVAALVICVRR